MTLMTLNMVDLKMQSLRESARFTRLHQQPDTPLVMYLDQLKNHLHTVIANEQRIIVSNRRHSQQGFFVLELATQYMHYVEMNHACRNTFMFSLQTGELHKNNVLALHNTQHYFIDQIQRITDGIHTGLYDIQQVAAT